MYMYVYTGDELAITKNKIDKIVNAFFWKMDDQAKPPYKFGYVACIISGVVSIYICITLLICNEFFQMFALFILPGTLYFKYFY